MNGTGRILVRYSGTESLAARHDRGRRQASASGVMADDLAAAIRSEHRR